MTAIEKILADEVAFQGKKVRVLNRKIDLGGGVVADWEIIDKGWDSVAIVAIGEENSVLLVDEYFGATNERSLCLPKGKIDAGEEPLEAAHRELQEEVGVDGDMELLTTLSLSPGYLTQRTFLYLARGLKPSRLQGDEVQYIQPVQLPLSEAIERCFSGSISEARTVAGLLMAGRAMQPESSE